MLKVLIVEDDPMIRMLTVRFIESLNDFQIVGEFGRSDEALNFLNSNKADLIILDMFLPDTSGLKLLKKIRKKDIWSKIIFVTASDASKDIEQAFHMGAIDYLIKPFSFDRLKESLNRCNLITENFTSKSKLTQSEIDRFHLKEDDVQTDNVKGIQTSTLDKVLNILKEDSTKEWSVKDVSEKSEISIVTVKKYLDHLVKIGRIRSELCYKSVGRPQYIYTFLI